MKSTVKKFDKRNSNLFVASKINKYLDIKNTLLIEKKSNDINMFKIKNYDYDYELYNEEIFQQPLKYH